MNFDSGKSEEKNSSEASNHSEKRNPRREALKHHNPPETGDPKKIREIPKK
jgi:hypothetical protein